MGSLPTPFPFPFLWSSQPPLVGRHPGSDAHPSPPSSTIPAPVSTLPSSFSIRDPSSPTPLSSDAVPFYPSENFGNRGKQLRWRDDSPLSDDEEDEDSGNGSPSYRDILLRPVSARKTPPATPPPATAGVLLSSSLSGSQAHHLGTLVPSRRCGAIAAFAGCCLNCLSFTHMMASCKLPTRCFRQALPPPTTLGHAVWSSTHRAALVVVVAAAAACHGDTVLASRRAHRASAWRDMTVAAEEGSPTTSAAATSGPTGVIKPISVEAIHRTFQDLPETRDDNFVVRRFALESFLVIFASQRTRDSAMRGGSMLVGAVHFFFRPWTRLVRAESDVLHHQVSLEVEGILTHAWGWRAARKILASPSLSPSPSLSDRDSSHNGNMDWGYSESWGDRGPRLQSFHCSPSLPDGSEAPQG
uniref:Uncharacterized protein n=1 Tax=Setaria viridis TaxID=4556 RepID=A0A4U6VFZ3_SETVI|nr:hypothetical protein SEVIR_3G250400v2 [Setaria viridis]